MAEIIQNNSPQIGDFRERIQIMKMQKTLDGFGGYTETWVLQKQIWGNIRMTETPVQTNQIRQEHVVNYEIFCRFTNILPEQRAIFRGQTAIIKNITELDNKKKFMSFCATIILN
jgi:SPP1 family predicted phage head-tail adaptor